MCVRSPPPPHSARCLAPLSAILLILSQRRRHPPLLSFSRDAVARSYPRPLAQHCRRRWRAGCWQRGRGGGRRPTQLRWPQCCMRPPTLFAATVAGKTESGWRLQDKHRRGEAASDAAGCAGVGCQIQLTAVVGLASNPAAIRSHWQIEIWGYGSAVWVDHWFCNFQIFWFLLAPT
jgi:hypothetical protein